MEKFTAGVMVSKIKIDKQIDAPKNFQKIIKGFSSNFFFDITRSLFIA